MGSPLGASGPGGARDGSKASDHDESGRLRLHEALSELRSRRQSLTNRTLARRAQALAPARASWHVDERRLSEWLRGVSVPHHVEALLAVVSVLVEDVSPGGVGEPRRLTMPERAWWTRLWHSERQLRRTPAAGDPDGAGRGAGGGAGQESQRVSAAPSALLGVQYATPDRLRLLDELADAMREHAVGRAGASTLLVPEPMALRWRADAEARPAAAGAVFEDMPGIEDTPAVAAEGGRSELFGLYAAGGHGRVVVVGDVGSGKTSSAVLLTLDALAHRAMQPPERRVQVPVPLLVDVSAWDVTTASTLTSILAVAAALDPELAASTTQSALRRVVQRGHVSLIVDGLDELPEELRRPVVGDLVRRVASRVVLFARPQTAEAVSDLLDGCTVIRLQELTDADVRAYLRLVASTPGSGQAAPGRWPVRLTDALPDAVRRPTGVVLLRDAPITGDGRTADRTAHEAWADGLLEEVAGSFAHPAQRRAVSGVLRVIARSAVAAGGSASVDWRRITAAVGGSRSLAGAAGALVAAVVGLAHVAQLAAHGRYGFRGVLVTANCLDITGLGRRVHEIGLAIAWTTVLGAAAAYAVRLRTTVAGGTTSRARAGTRRSGPGLLIRGTGHLLLVAAAGGVVNAATWLVTAGAFEIAGTYVPTAACAVFPSASPPAARLLFDAAGRGAVIATALALPVLVTLGVHRARAEQDLGQLKVRTRTVVMSCAVASALIGMTVMRRAGVGDISLPFVPRTDVARGTQRLVQVLDGVVVGLDAGLSAALAITVLAAVLLAGTSRPVGARLSWARAWPSGPAPAGLVGLLLVGALVAEWFVLSLTVGGRRPNSLWLLALVPVVLLVRRMPHRTVRPTPASALLQDRRFARSVTGLVLLTMLPMQLVVLRSADVLSASWNPPGSEHAVWRVAACAVTVCAVAALGSAWAVTERPLVLLCDAYLSCRWRCRLRLVTAVERAHRYGLLWTVGTEFRFRHPDYAARLAAGTRDQEPPSSSRTRRQEVLGEL